MSQGPPEVGIFRVASWNVNSIRVRLERVLAWLDRYRPDVLCLQELKAPDDRFPHEAVAEIGYRAAVHGQKTYNGVAVLAREQHWGGEEPVDVGRGMGDGEEDPQARLLAATVAGVRVVSAYVPNGGHVGSEKYAYKLRWLGRFRRWVDALPSGTPLLLCGDFNIAADPRDLHDVSEWEGSVLFNDEMRAWMADLQSRMEDTFRIHEAAPGQYSWWDYRGLAFPRNAGLRIDYVLASPELAARCAGAWIDRDERRSAGRDTKPSDHVPVVADLRWPTSGGPRAGG